MGQYARAQKLWKSMPEEVRNQLGYGNDLSRNEWQDFKDFYGRSPLGLYNRHSDAYEGMKDLYSGKANLTRNAEGDFEVTYNDAEINPVTGESKGFEKDIADREKLWQKYRTDVQNLLTNAPAYKIPEIITTLTEKLNEAASNIKGEYTSTAEALQNIASDKLSTILEDVKKGTQEQFQLAEKGATEIKDIYNKGASEVEDYLSNIDQIYQAGGKIVGAAEQGVSEMKGYSEKGLAAGLEGVKGYEDTYTRLATQTQLPGEDIYAGQLGAERESIVSRIKEYGAGSSEGLNAIASAYQDEQTQLRQLAIERANYLTENQKAYAESQLTGGLAKSDLYGTAAEQTAQRTGILTNAYTGQAGLVSEGIQLGVQGTQAATGMRAQGSTQATGLLTDASRYATEKNLSAQQYALGTELDVTQQAGMLRAMGYENEANMMLQSGLLKAEYEDKAWQQNVLQPYQNQLSYSMQNEQYYDPFGYKYKYQGDIRNYGLAQQQLNQQEDMANREMLYNLLGQLGQSTGGLIESFQNG